MTSIANMSSAVSTLTRWKKDQLVDWEEESRRLGVEPAPDLAFAGVRTLVARSEAAAIFLAALAPHEQRLLDALKQWQAETRAQRDAVTAGAV
jgi:hypothetical protein